MSEPVIYEVRDRVAWITINRPEQRNAMNLAVRSGLFESFKKAEEDERVRVIVLTGAGDRAFSAGGDLKEMSGNSLGVPAADFAPRLRRNIHVTKPTIAAVNGFAYAGGFLLAQMCDLCVASESASFAITEAKWSRGAPWSIPAFRQLPQRIMLELLLTAQPIGAARMHELGFVNRLAPADQLVEATTELAGVLVENAPLTIKGHIQMAYLGQEMGVTAAEEAADAIFVPIYSSEDAKEGPRAFAEKRKPEWRGR
ncbi:enoyl-CoA hydratase-related protein [Dietzia sp. CH92]|uniref:enoyl-CoA hydratase/isomerase family protein n=1 Tax=Dietzia sp. CH92 TaxID=3051823 RepID=UPI0028D7B7B2|nr:enoyl-CoA hydratase-related protein [Dietzia sp. CH92]